MKKLSRDWIILFCIISAMLLVLGVKTYNYYYDKVLHSLQRPYETKKYSDIGFGGAVYTNLYYFNDTDAQREKLINNKYFKLVTENDIEQLSNDVEFFYTVMPHANFSEGYDFDENIVDTSDYIYIKTEDKHDKFPDDFKSYFYDTQTNTLYYTEVVF